VITSKLFQKLIEDKTRNSLAMAFGFLRYGFVKYILRKKEVIQRVLMFKMALGLDQKGLSRELMVYGVHESMETQLIQEVLRPGMHALDVGGNIGYYALLEASIVGRHGRVLVLEPAPKNFERLKRNIALNRLSDRIVAFNFAAGDADGYEKMYLGILDNMHCLMKYPNDHRYRGSIVVETVKLDHFLAGRRKIDFLRMDLEGYECQVLEGMKEIIERDRPSLLIEMHPTGDIDPDPRYTPSIEYLIQMGYQARSVICSAKERSMKTFRALGYSPSVMAFHGFIKYVRYDHVHSRDIIHVAARRPKIARAIYFSTEKKSRISALSG
jgi:FkbM family methyltransferase